jgi:multiple sugar transport system substrate-binding protein
LLSAQELPEMQVPFYLEAAGAINNSVCRNWAGTLERPSEAAEQIATVIFKLIKEDPTLDIATELQKVQDEYNANN